MVSALVACLAFMADAIPPELDAYIKRPDPSFAWSEKKEGSGSLHLRMTSQTWRNVRWTHDIVVSNPKAQPGGPKPGACILYITGGEPNKADLNEAQRLADLAKMPVALLFQIPNQPLFGMKEDDLIAHTFEQYLKEAMTPPSTLDPRPSTLADWPLLLPMVKSAVRAMDALQAATKGTKAPFEKFIVTGASKRGWTAWLTGAIEDKRVVGIAPMVFDNLKFKAQLKHQLESWGKYSEMLGDYMDRGLDQVLDTPQGTRLVSIVDPYTYLSRITIPKLIVNGSNDRYWTVDALSLYWDDLKGPKYCTIVPNAGHLLGDMNQALHAIAAFSRSCAGEFELPSISSSRFERDGKSYLGVRFRDPESPVVKDGKAVPEPLEHGGFWVATSATGDFRESKWEHRRSVAIGGAGHSSATWLIESKGPEKAAVFGQVNYNLGGLAFSLSTPVVVSK